MIKHAAITETLRIQTDLEKTRHAKALAAQRVILDSKLESIQESVTKEELRHNTAKRKVDDIARRKIANWEAIEHKEVVNKPNQTPDTSKVGSPTRAKI